MASWIKVGRADPVEADLTVAGPNEVTAELPLSRRGQRAMQQAAAGRHVLIGEDGASVDGTVTGSSPSDYTVTVMTRRL